MESGEGYHLLAGEDDLPRDALARVRDGAQTGPCFATAQVDPARLDTRSRAEALPNIVSRQLY